jgi:hypothetical protein
MIVTRASNLPTIFRSLGPKVGNKYGASTTHMEKLLPRIEGGGGGGCPILAVGITSAKYVEDNAPIVLNRRARMVTKTASEDLAIFSANRRFSTVLADPPWRFQNSTGKVAPEHRRLSRYGTLSLNEIKALPVATITASTSHLYLWVPNALLAEGLAVMAAWGFTYKSNIVWHKIRKDGGPDGRGVGFYFRNVTELVLFGVRGKNARTLAPGVVK